LEEVVNEKKNFVWEFEDVWPEAQKQLDEADRILLSQDQDEIDLFLFKFYS
jgi:hypothetical protein